MPAARLAAKGGRLEYRRGPILTEWYLNTAWGLEQGFTLNRRLSAADDRPSLVVLELALSGTVRPHLKDDDPSTGSGQALLLHDVRGQAVARYTGLYAYDSDGKTLPAHLSLSPRGETRGEGGMLRISVDDSAARYPITIDPWVQQAKLTASDAAAGDYFGNSVAIDGDTVVVGAHRDNWDSGLDQDSAYVLVKPGGGWADMTQTAKLTASDGAESDTFGNSVAIDGGTVVVGAWLDNAPATDSGSAYIFVPLDSDGDGIPDYIEDSGCTDTYDADTDEDGIIDGVEDANHDGVWDEGETDPCNIDSDGDGIQDGTESGYTMGDIGPDTDTGVFQPDLNSTTTTDPLDDDTDNDGLKDGEEDTNHNGRVDPGERDPNRPNRGFFHWLLLFED